MEKSTSYIPAAEGVLRGFVVTVFMLLLFAVLMTFVDVSEKISSMFYLITTLLSIMYGSIYAVKKINRRGWLIGLIVAFIYISILYIVSIMSGNSAVIGTDRLCRFGLALLVGIFSGIIGVNL